MTGLAIVGRARRPTPPIGAIAFDWLVAHVPRAPRRPAPEPLGPIEARVLAQLARAPSCVPELARDLGATTPEAYEQVRNAVYRLVDKGLVARRGTVAGPRGTLRRAFAATPRARHLLAERR